MRQGLDTSCKGASRISTPSADPAVADATLLSATPSSLVLPYVVYPSASCRGGPPRVQVRSSMPPKSRPLWGERELTGSGTPISGRDDQGTFRPVGRWSASRPIPWPRVSSFGSGPDVGTHDSASRTAIQIRGPSPTAASPGCQWHKSSASVLVLRGSRISLISNSKLSASTTVVT